MLEPLYYCSVCKKPVDVTPVEGGEAIIKWRCEHVNTTVIAPRKVTLYGESGMSFSDSIILRIRQLLSNLLGRNV